MYASNSAAQVSTDLNTASTPTITQEGEINPGTGVYTYYPSIEIAADGPGRQDRPRHHVIAL